MRCAKSQNSIPIQSLPQSRVINGGRFDCNEGEPQAIRKVNEVAGVGFAHACFQQLLLGRRQCRSDVETCIVIT